MKIIFNLNSAIIFENYFHVSFFWTICYSCLDLVFVILIDKHLSMFLIGRQTLRAYIVKLLDDNNDNNNNK